MHIKICNGNVTEMYQALAIAKLYGQRNLRLSLLCHPHWNGRVSTAKIDFCGAKDTKVIDCHGAKNASTINYRSTTVKFLYNAPSVFYTNLACNPIRLEVRRA